MSEQKTQITQITRELAEEVTLIFYPKTEEEAVLIQKKLFNLEIYWIDGDKNICETAACVAQGMNVRQGKLQYGFLLNDEIRNNGIVCNISSFTEGLNINKTDYLKGDALVREVFNRLANRIESLENEVRELRKPPQLAKPHLGKKGS